MYFWNINKLKSDIREGRLTETQSMFYLLANILLYQLVLVFYTYDLVVGSFIVWNVWDIYTAIVTTILIVAGIHYVYKCNKGASGNHFLKKFLSIGWVAGIRWLILVVLPSTLTLEIVRIMVSSNTPEHTTPIDVVFMSALCVLFFWLVGKHVKEVAE
jgi:hypothetical protein